MADIYLGEDVKVTLTVVYIFAAIASIWITIFSPYLLEWLGVKLNKRPKNVRDWPKIFLIFLILQPLTFMMSSIGLWWVKAFAYIPAIHFALTFLSFIAIDFFRVEESWERDYDYARL